MSLSFQTTNTCWYNNKTFSMTRSFVLLSCMTVLIFTLMSLLNSKFTINLPVSFRVTVFSKILLQINLFFIGDWTTYRLVQFRPVSYQKTPSIIFDGNIFVIFATAKHGHVIAKLLKRECIVTVIADFATFSAPLIPYNIRVAF